MKAIVTYARADGTFDEVGMNNRTLFSDLTTFRGVVRRARRFRTCHTSKIRIELFTDSGFYGKPFRTEIV